MGQIRLVFQKLLKVQLGAVIYTGILENIYNENELKFEVRAYIKGRVGLKVSASQVYSELCQIHGPSKVARTSVFRWHKKFKMGKTDLNDAPVQASRVELLLKQMLLQSLT